MKALLVIAVFLTACAGKEQKEPAAANPVLPSSITAIHADLLGRLHAITELQDSSGRAALKLEELMKHHFEEEERYVLPVLGALPDLANGRKPAAGLEKNIDWYTKNAMHLEAEHQFIRALMEELVAASAMDGHPEVKDLEADLRQHAEEEKQIMFPAVQLAGLYLAKIKAAEN